MDAPSRVYRACYFHAEHGWRVALILQRRNVDGFECGIIRDASEGGQDQLRSISMTTLDAVIWLGLHLSQTPVKWEIVL